MAKYGQIITESIGWEIYERWCAYSRQINSVPEPYVFHARVLVAIDGYPITQGGFRHWLERLQIPQKRGADPYVWRDEITKAWCLRDVKFPK